MFYKMTAGLHFSDDVLLVERTLDVEMKPRLLCDCCIRNVGSFKRDSFDTVKCLAFNTDLQCVVIHWHSVLLKSLCNLRVSCR